MFEISFLGISISIWFFSTLLKNSVLHISTRDLVSPPNIATWSGYEFEDNYVQEIEEPSGLSIDSKQKLGGKEKGVLSGFKLASKLDNHLER